jgi:hypothetical protein
MRPKHSILPGKGGSANEFQLPPNKPCMLQRIVMFIYASGTAFSMHSKRGFTTIEIIVFVVPIVLVAIIILFNLGWSQAGFSKQYNSLQLLSKIQACKIDGQLNPKAVDVDFSKAKGDGYPDDACDVCLGGDDAKDDGDMDGMPDACDNEPKNRPAKGVTFKQVCEGAKGPGGPGTWNEEKMQCTLKCYSGRALNPSLTCPIQ